MAKKKKTKLSERDIERTKKTISKIRSIQSKREKEFITKDLKKRTAQELIDNKGEIKRKSYLGGSKVEAGTEVALTKITKGIGKLSKQKIKVKKVLKKSRIDYKMPKREIENVWEDESRFFKGNYKNEKKKIFID